MRFLPTSVPRSATTVAVMRITPCSGPSWAPAKAANRAVNWHQPSTLRLVHSTTMKEKVRCSRIHSLRQRLGMVDCRWWQTQDRQHGQPRLAADGRSRCRCQRTPILDWTSGNMPINPTTKTVGLTTSPRFGTFSDWDAVTARMKAA